jgi:hypothetical protein
MFGFSIPFCRAMPKAEKSETAKKIVGFSRPFCREAGEVGRTAEHLF